MTSTDTRNAVAQEFRRWHQDVCYPSCSDDEALLAADAILAAMSRTPPTPATDEREAVARAMCKSDGTSQCAAICLSHFASSTRNGKCAEAVSVWGKRADAALSALAPFRQRELDAKPCKKCGNVG